MGVSRKDFAQRKEELKELRQMFNDYVDINRSSVQQIAKAMDIGYHQLQRWKGGSRNLSKHNEIKVRNYLADTKALNDMLLKNIK